MSWIERRADAITVGFFVLILVLNGLIFPRLVNHDASVFLDLGYRMLDGERLYVDYQENDLPAIHYLSVIPTAIARALDIPASTPFSLMLWAAALASCLYAGRLARRRLNIPMLGAIFQVMMAVFSAYLYQRNEWGQREHILLILFMPWFFMRIARYQGESFSPLTMFAAGVAAGIGVAIKPYFFLIALLPELYLLATTRRFRMILTWDVLGVVLVALAHVLYFGLQPEVWAAFQRMSGRLLAGYGAYGSQNPLTIPITDERAPQSVVALIPLVAWLAVPRWRKHIPRVVIAIAYASLGGLLVIVLQGKGWSYHEAPFLWMNGLILGWLAPFIIAKLGLGRLLTRRFLPLMIIIVGGYATFYADLTVIWIKYDRYLYDLSGIIETYTVRGDSVMFVDAGLIPMYPMLVTMNRHNASRYSMAGALPVAYYHYEGLPYTDPAHVVPAYAQEYLDDFAKDLALRTPSLIFIRSEWCIAACNSYVVDFYDYFAARGVIDKVILPDYDLLIVEHGFHVYLRKGVQSVHTP